MRSAARDERDLARADPFSMSRQASPFISGPAWRGRERCCWLKIGHLVATVIAMRASNGWRELSRRPDAQRFFACIKGDRSVGAYRGTVRAIDFSKQRDEITFS
jgi:hypothetical protein